MRVYTMVLFYSSQPRWKLREVQDGKGGSSGAEASRISRLRWGYDPRDERHGSCSRIHAIKQDLEGRVGVRLPFSSIRGCRSDHDLSAGDRRGVGLLRRIRSHLNGTHPDQGEGLRYRADSSVLESGKGRASEFFYNSCRQGGGRDSMGFIAFEV